MTRLPGISPRELLFRSRRRPVSPGLLSLAMFVTGGLSALAAGCSGDLLPRKRVLILVVLFSELACLLTYWTNTFQQLLVLRALQGVALGAAPPLVYSCLADMVGPGERPLATAVMTIAASGGALIGQVVAGYIGSTLGWRVPFLAVGAPGLLFTSALTLLISEPRRGNVEPAILARSQSTMALQEGRDEEAWAHSRAPAQPEPAQPERADDPGMVYAERLTLSKLLALLRVPTNLLIFAQSVPACIPWGVMGIFAVDFVAQDRQMGVKAAVNGLLLYACGGFCGALGGNVLIAHLRARFPRHGVRALGIISGSCTLAAIGPVTYILKGAYGPDKFGTLGGMTFASGVLTYVTVPAIRNALLNVNRPETRGSAYSMYVLLDFLGRGLGPLAVASLARQKGRQAAFADCVLLWCASGPLIMCLAWTLPRDEKKLHAHMLSARLEPCTAAGALG